MELSAFDDRRSGGHTYVSGAERRAFASTRRVETVCVSRRPGSRYHEERLLATGTVKWFNDTKGYGFIQSDDGGDVFVHHSAVVGEGHRTLQEGQRVEFEVIQDAKGPKASNVKPDA